MLRLKVVVRLCSIGFMLLVPHAALSASSLFQTAQSYSSGGLGTFSVAVADVNGDGKPDVFVGNSCALGNCAKSVVSLLLGNGDGTFQAARTLDPGAEDPESMAVKDINGDGKPDLLIANACINPNDCRGTLSVLFGHGD